MISNIYVAPIHRPPPGAVDHALRRLPEVFGVPAAILTPSINVRKAFDDSRGQYQSQALLAELLEHAPDGAKLVGVTDVDLFVPVLTFVFGEAQLGGRVAIASSHRLHNSFYGLPEDEDLMLARLEKEIVHELGHTFGLRHCGDYMCVMYSSTAVEDIDLKNATFCPSCRKDIRR